MHTNRVKRILQQGGVVIGSEVTRIPHPEVVRVYAAAGFDFAFIDLEHTGFSLETAAQLIAAAKVHGISPIVRVPQAEYSFISRALDCGAEGIIVPRVNTPDEVRQIVSWVRYPPQGIRGFACTVAQTGGREIEPVAFMEAVHRETLLVIQIEREEAVRNLDEMLSIEGVDVACLGYMDLSVDLRLPGQMDHPRLIACIERLVEAANACGIAAGIIHPDPAVARRWIQQGMRFVSHAGDFLWLHQAAAGAVSFLREAISELDSADRARQRAISS